MAHPTDRKLREFAAAGAVVCLALATWQSSSGHPGLAGIWILFALTAGSVGAWRPRWLAPLYRAAMIVTFPLAWAVSLLVLALLFYGLFTPLGLLFRLLGRDTLERQVHPRSASYWKPKPSADDHERYLRQY